MSPHRGLEHTYALPLQVASCVLGDLTARQAEQAARQSMAMSAHTRTSDLRVNCMHDIEPTSLPPPSQKHPKARVRPVHRRPAPFTQGNNGTDGIIWEWHWRGTRGTESGARDQEVRMHEIRRSSRVQRRNKNRLEHGSGAPFTFRMPWDLGNRQQVALWRRREALDGMVWILVVIFFAANRIPYGEFV